MSINLCPPSLLTVLLLPSLPGPIQSTSLVVDLYSLLLLAANRKLPSAINPDILLQCPYLSTMSSGVVHFLR